MFDRLYFPNVWLVFDRIRVFGWHFPDALIINKVHVQYKW